MQFSAEQLISTWLANCQSDVNFKAIATKFNANETVNKIFCSIAANISTVPIEKRNDVLQVAIRAIANVSGVAEYYKHIGAVELYRKLTFDYRPEKLQQLFDGGISQGASLNYLQMLANLDSCKQELGRLHFPTYL